MALAIREQQVRLARTSHRVADQDVGHAWGNPELCQSLTRRGSGDRARVVRLATGRCRSGVLHSSLPGCRCCVADSRLQGCCRCSCTLLSCGSDGCPLAVCCLQASRYLSLAALLDSSGLVGTRDL